MKRIPPWSRQELLHAYFHDREGLESILRAMPGFHIAQKLEEMATSYSIFVSATEDLFESIHRFKLLEGRSKLYDRHSRVIVEDSITAVRRGIFAACAASMALVDHTRRIAGAVNVQGYNDEIQSRFANSKLHNFVQGLRNYSVHRTIAGADWQVNFKNKAKSVLFLISKECLSEWDEWKPLAKQLINETVQGVDVEATFEEYAKQIEDFSRWLRHKIIKSGEDNYQEYLYYKNIIDGFREYYGINLLVSHLSPDAKANPDMYLDRFLTSEQIDVVLSLPAKSKERVDKLISLVDLHDACDNTLRTKLYGLFGVKDA
ncbi:MAG: hypothetical protein ACYC1T_10835 [Sulfuricaulis sp.]